MSFSVERIDHVEVFVRDIEAAILWYRDVLGLQETARWNPEPVMIGAGETMLALFRRDPAVNISDAASIPQAGWRRVAWRTSRDGFARAQEHLCARRIDFRGPIDHGSAYSIYFHDPDGNPLEITYYV